MERRLQVTVTVPLSEVLDTNFEGFLDLLAETVGHPLLMDIDYKLVGVDNGDPVFEVSGDYSMEREVAHG